MGKVEKKVLGALLIMANDDFEVRATQIQIAEKMGYATHGGAIGSALKLLEMRNYIKVIGKSQYQVLI